MTTNYPPHFQVDRIDFPEPRSSAFGNGLKSFILEGGSQEVCKIDLMFLAGRPFEHKRLTAATLASTIKEGTLGQAAAMIADAVDHRGATISSPFSFDHISLQLTCLTKHVTHLLPTLIEIIRQPSFDAAELQLFKNRTIQRLAVDLSNNDVIAYRKATEQYFGADHPYGYNSDISMYGAVDRDDLLLHHGRYFTPKNALLFIAGRMSERLLEQIEDLVEDWEGPDIPAEPRLQTNALLPSHIIENMNKPQSAIRVGRRLFNRNHPDWPAFFVLNTILGGYFGSRLMKNLRESRGFTYGVQSSLESLKFDGYFSISLETDRKYVKKALGQIYREIEVLQNELVPGAELQMVKNYLGGYLLSMLDGPIQTLEVVKNNLAEDSPFDFTSTLLCKIAELSSHDIQHMAQRYLNKQDLSEVIIH
ncbi:MAG: insulinase family protein [Saprospiraceae bacterium]|nr:insulinase family protein [Saprospiraceae bacterium]